MSIKEIRREFVGQVFRYINSDNYHTFGKNGYTDEYVHYLEQKLTIAQQPTDATCSCGEKATMSFCHSCYNRNMGTW